MPVHLVASVARAVSSGTCDGQQRQHVQVLQQTLDGLTPGRAFAREIEMAVERRDGAVVLAQLGQRALALRESGGSGSVCVWLISVLDGREARIESRRCAPRAAPRAPASWASAVRRPDPSRQFPSAAAAPSCSARRGGAAHVRRASAAPSCPSGPRAPGARSARRAARPRAGRGCRARAGARCVVRSPACSMRRTAPSSAAKPPSVAIQRREGVRRASGRLARRSRCSQAIAQRIGQRAERARGRGRAARRAGARRSPPRRRASGAPSSTACSERCRRSSDWRSSRAARSCSCCAVSSVSLARATACTTSPWCNCCTRF